MKQDAAPNSAYILRIDMQRFFTGGIPEQLRYDLECHQRAESLALWLECHQRAESLALWLECDVDLVKKTAQKLAKATGITYLQAIDEVGRTFQKKNEPTPCSLCSALTQPKHCPKMNRAQRRRLKREKRK